MGRAEILPETIANLVRDETVVEENVRFRLCKWKTECEIVLKIADRDQPSE